MTATLSETVETSRLSIWMGAIPKLFCLSAVWIQFGAIWINLKTLPVKWWSHCLSLNVNILWTILSGLHLAKYATKSISKFRRNVNKILFSYYRLENGGHISRPQYANKLLLKQNSLYFANDILIHFFLICFTFAHAILILKNEFEIVVCKISAILYLPGCVNTLWQRQSDLYFEDAFSNSFLTEGEIWKKNKNLYTWNASHVSAAMLWGRDKMVPLSRWYIYIYMYIYIYSNQFSCMELFYYLSIFKFDFSVFLNFHTEIYCVILSSCTESGSNAVHRMTSLLGNVFLNAGPMCGPWVTVGSLHKGPVIQRYICTRLIHFALFFLLISVKRRFGFVLAMCILA